MFFVSSVSFWVVLFVCFAAFGQPAKDKMSANSLFGKNLIYNGNAEAGDKGIGNVRGWTPKDAIEIDSYGHVGGEWDVGILGAPDGGENYFRITIDNGIESKTASQTVDVAAAAKEIDAGKAEYSASGFLGGIRTEHGTMILTLTFTDASGKELARSSTKPVDPPNLPAPPRT